MSLLYSSLTMSTSDLNRCDHDHTLTSAGLVSTPPGLGLGEASKLDQTQAHVSQVGRQHADELRQGEGHPGLVGYLPELL